MPKPGDGAVVELDVGGEAARVAADDGERQGKAVARGADHRLRAAADAHPSAERGAFDRRENTDDVERRAYGSVPPDRLARAVGVPECRADGDLLLEQDVVVIERVAEER